VAERKTALQRRAASGDIRAEELVRQDQGENLSTKSCPYCGKAKSLADLPLEELKQRRAELQAVIDYTPPINNLPPTVHIEELTEKEQVRQVQTQEEVNHGNQAASEAGHGQDNGIIRQNVAAGEAETQKGPATYRRE
jgi:glutaredoxin